MNLSTTLPFERHTLANGLRVILHQDTSLPLVAVCLWYHVGSKNEKPGRTGFAHLFEHMLFQGSQHVATHQHFAYIQQVGGIANGSTWYDRTNYYETLPSHHLDLGLWLESDRMGFFLPALTRENLETQRQVVMNERRQHIENQPYGRANERLNELLYPPEHPHHWPVMGYVEDIAAATLEDVRLFFRTWYTPNNAVLTLAGDFSPAAALAGVETYFAEIPAGPPLPPLPPIVAHPPPLGGERRATLEDNVRLPRVYLAFRAPAYGHRLWYAADLLTSMLAGGKSTDLYRDLVYDRQIAQDVSAYLNPFEATASLVLVATARPGVAIAEVEEALLGHLARVAAAPPDPAALESARNRMLTAHYGGLQLLGNRADLFCQFTTYFDDPAGVAAEADRYRRIEPADVHEYAASFLDERGRVSVTVLPRAGNG
jgi:zinc protease